jgi:hypothetical protein
MMEILCTHIWKWKNKVCWNYSKNGGNKENDRGGEFNYDIFCKYHNVPPYSNNMILKILKNK